MRYSVSSSLAELAPAGKRRSRAQGMLRRAFFTIVLAGKPAKLGKRDPLALANLGGRRGLEHFKRIAVKRNAMPEGAERRPRRCAG